MFDLTVVVSTLVSSSIDISFTVVLVFVSHILFVQKKVACVS